MFQASNFKMSFDKKITVDDLLVKPFSVRSEEEKHRIVSEGRPTPLVKIKGPPREETSQSKRNASDELKVRRQKILDTTKSMYNDIPWLTASATTQNFYCWPCLLFQFPQTPKVWHVSGFSDVLELRTTFADHKFTLEHLEAACKHRVWQYQDRRIVTKENVPSEYDEKSLNVIKKLTSVVFTVASLQLPPRDFNNDRSDLDIKQCLSSLQLLRKYEVNEGSTEEAIDLLQNSPGFVVNLTKGIAKSIRQTIAQEIDSCKYVSIILNRHSNVKLEALISTVLRYVKCGKVCERFVEFSHSFENATVESLCTHVTRIAEEFNIESKCVALSIDGAILTSDDVSMLLIRCHTKLEHCIFVPCYSHTVDEVLQKSLSLEHTRVENFFKIMADFHACFWDPNSQFNVVFNRYLSRSRINNVNISPRINNGSSWLVASDFIICVQKHRQIFISFLDEASSADFTLSASDISKALGFREFLSDFFTVFLIRLFSEIFHLTSTLNAALSTDSPERIVNKQMVLTLVHSLTALKDGGYKRLLSSVLQEIGNDASRSNDVRPPDVMFKNILKTVIGEVEMRYRYGHIDKFQFFRLFDFDERECFDFLLTSNRYKDLAQMYDVDYQLNQTVHEMGMISKHEAFWKKSVYDFHQYLHESNLKHAFRALYDFSELALALPLKPPSSTKEASIQEKIDKWSFGPTQKLDSENADIIFIESDNLAEIKQSRTFYDRVIANMKADMIAK